MTENITLFSDNLEPLVNLYGYGDLIQISNLAETNNSYFVRTGVKERLLPAAIEFQARTGLALKLLIGYLRPIHIQPDQFDLCCHSEWLQAMHSTGGGVDISFTGPILSDSDSEQIQAHLRVAMYSQGFTQINSRCHFDFGNLNWAKVKGKKPIYGSMSNPVII